MGKLCPEIDCEVTQVSAAKTYLGSLCKRGHDHEGTGKSLRRRNSSTCVGCETEASRRWTAANPERRRAICLRASRKARAADPEKNRAAARMWRKKYPEKAKAKDDRRRAENLDRERDRVRLYDALHRDERRDKARARYHADPEKGRRKSRAWALANPEKVREMRKPKTPEQEKRSSIRQACRGMNPDVARARTLIYEANSIIQAVQRGKVP
jgi:hypothetical protein